MVCFLTCPVLVKFPHLFGNHRLGQEAGDSEVPARGRKLLETAQAAEMNQDCYMSKNMTKSLDKNYYYFFKGPTPSRFSSFS